MLELLFILVFVWLFAAGVNAFHDNKVKECSYHQWEFKAENGSRLQCSKCGKIVTNED